MFWRGALAFLTPDGGRDMIGCERHSMHDDTPRGQPLSVLAVQSDVVTRIRVGAKGQEETSKGSGRERVEGEGGRGQRGRTEGKGWNDSAELE